MTQAAFDEAKALREVRERCFTDFEYYAETCLKIRPKDGNITPFVVNKAQKMVLERRRVELATKGRVRMIVLKGRQQGMSTLIEALGFHKTVHNFGITSFILAHEEKATKNLFELTKRYYENLPPIMQPKLKASNAIELAFSELKSCFKLGTAKNKDTGRSQTIQFLHASEAAFYAHTQEHAKGIMQAVPDMDGTEVYMESTANGVGNWFHKMWQDAEAGQSDYIAVFVPWFITDEYKRKVPDDFALDDEEKLLKATYLLSDEQLAWRRVKIQSFALQGRDGLKAFQQEYPCCPIEAFNSDVGDIFIQSELVATARKSVFEATGPLLIGVDPAYTGNDRTAIIRRRGRVAFGLKTYLGISNMELAGVIHNIITEENPDKVFIDFGMGTGVYDRLCELGHKKILVLVNSACTALNDERYTNKRAEMWAIGKQWLEEGAQVPDSEELHSDLSSCKRANPDSRGRLKIESKADQRSRGVRSSDTADALLLTFALPVSAYESDKAERFDTSFITHKLDILDEYYGR